jgi:predicted transcriptional regulator
VKAVRYANAKRYEPMVSEEDYKAKFMNSFVGDYFKIPIKRWFPFLYRKKN